MQTTLKQRLDGLISNYEELEAKDKEGTVSEALEHLRSAQQVLEGYEEQTPEPKEGQLA